MTKITKVTIGGHGVDELLGDTAWKELKLVT